MPLNNMYEVKAMIDGTLPYNGWSIQLTPIYIKVYKDILTFLFAFVTIFMILKYDYVRRILKKKKLSSIYLLIIIILLTTVGVFLIGEPIDAIVGLRGFSSLVYFFLGISVSRVVNIRAISRCLLFMLIIQLAIQFYEFFSNSGIPVFGELRSPGFFIVPATSGLFAILTAYYFILSNNKKFISISFVSVILSNSTAGIMAMLLALGYYFIHKLSKNNRIVKYYFIFASFPLAIFFLITNISAISNRDVGASSSFLSRIIILKEYLSNMTIFDLFLGGKFGQATAFAVLDNSSSRFIADNSFLVILVSMGIIALICYIVFFIKFLYLDKDKIMSITLFFYGMTANIFDLSPVSQLLFFTLGFIWASKSFYIVDNRFTINQVGIK